MIRLKQPVQAAILLLALYFSAASIEDNTEYTEYVNGTWVIENLYDGQTAVPRDIVIRLTIGYRDFAESSDSPIDDDVKSLAESTFELVSLRDQKKSGGPKLETEIHDSYTLLRPDRLLDSSTYSLDISKLRAHLTVIRNIPESIRFTTSSAPQITGLWRNKDTLIISFSEPMDSTSLAISQDSVDILWRKDDVLYSVASDLNLADFAWQTEGNLFLISPMSVLEERWTKDACDSIGKRIESPTASTNCTLSVDYQYLKQERWIKIAREVRGESGGLLDGSANGVSGQDDDTFVQSIVGPLPICYSREDIPDPCISDEEYDFSNDDD